jgi:hypothetical protein
MKIADILRLGIVGRFNQNICAKTSFGVSEVPSNRPGLARIRVELHLQARGCASPSLIPP